MWQLIASVGHTEGTAGIAGVLKACLAMKNGIMPPNLLFKKLAPALEPFYKNLEVVASPRVWPEPSSGQCRRASVNSFGKYPGLVRRARN